MLVKFAFSLRSVFIKLLKKTELIFLFFIILLALFIGNEFLHIDGIAPSDFDESNLYSSVKLFYETNCLKSFNSINEDRSIIGSYNWYGPLITLFYGLIFKATSFSNLMFFNINFIFYFISVLLSLSLFKLKSEKISFLFIFLSSYILSFVFVYFPETLIVLFTIILLNLYIRIKDLKSIVYFIFVLILFSFFRLTFVFWAVSILFLPSNLISNKIKASLFFVIVIPILIYMKFFTAPSSILGFGDIHSGNSIDLLSTFRHLFSNFTTNLYRLFDRSNSSIIFFLFSLIIVFLNFFTNYKKIQRLHYGLFFVIIVTFISYLILYSTYWYFFEKQIAFVLPLIFYLIVKDFSFRDKNIYISICVLLFLPISITKTRQNIIDKKKAFIENVKENNKIVKLNNFSCRLKDEGKDEINVLFKRNDFDIDYNRFISLLPLSFNKKPLLYSSNIVESEKDKDVFKLHNKIRIDYIMSSKILKLEYVNLIYSDNLMFLYKIVKNDKK